MKFNKLLLILNLFFTPLFLNSCGIDFESEKTNDEIYQVYKLAKASGFDGTYDEWLLTVQGKPGNDGTDGKDGKGIVNIAIKEETKEKIVYTISYSDKTTSEVSIPLIKGKDGRSVLSIELTKTEGIVDTYTIKYSDDTTTEFVIVNGKNGATGIQGVKGEDGHNPVVSVNEEGYWVVDDVVTNIKAQGPKGDKGDKGQDGTNGKSAYELYLEAHPEYTKGEDMWVRDLINGNLGTKITHQVTFNTGSTTVIPPQTIEHGEKITKPSDPVLEGYTFDGWTYRDEIWSFVGYVVTEDMELVAKWILN